MSRTALIAGATGLVGISLIQLLLESDTYSKVISIQRKPDSYTHPKLQTIQTDFSDLSNISLPEIDDTFCCLGTTIKTAGSRAAFSKVDLEYPISLAHLAVKYNTAHYLVISSMGANPNAFFFYSQIKGRLEKEVSDLLELPKLSIIRPSLLMGNRIEKRRGEKVGTIIAEVINPLLTGSLKKYRGIKSNDVAKAMYKIALSPAQEHVHIYLSDELQDIAANR
jgi:uncharacterized protein YbjT (DUF2867 family)